MTLYVYDLMKHRLQRFFILLNNAKLKKRYIRNLSYDNLILSSLRKMNNAILDPKSDEKTAVHISPEESRTLQGFGSLKLYRAFHDDRRVS